MKVFIENEAGSHIKHEHNEKTLHLKGKTAVSRPFPWPYGFVLETTAEDGDNVDCHVLTETMLPTGEIVECEPVGLMEHIEDDEIDHKVLAVLPGETVSVSDDTKKKLTDFAMRVFEHIPGKKMHVGRFLDRQAAMDYVESHMDAVKR